MSSIKNNSLKIKQILIIIVGIIISISIAKYNLNKFDINIEDTSGVWKHQMIKSDLAHTWEVADQFRSKLSNNEGFFDSLPVYERTFLHPILIGYFYYCIDKKIYDNNEKEINVIKINNYKIGILLFQILFYYISVYYLTNKIKKKIGSKFFYTILIFLSLEPSIIHWQASFWSESLYLTMLIVLLTLMIDVSKNKFLNFLTGILIGLMFAQRSISIFYILPFIIYYFSIFKKNLSPSFFLITGYIFLLSLIGYNHYKKIDSFHIISSQTQYYSYYHYFAHLINADRLNIDPTTAKYNMDFEEKKWRSLNGIEIKDQFETSHSSDIFKSVKYRNKIFINEVIQNPLFTAKLFCKKLALMIIIHPTWSTETNLLDKSSLIAKEKPQIYFHKNLKRNLIYSFFIYFFVLIGSIKFILNLWYKQKIDQYDKFLLLNFISILYFITIAGFWGSPRYFAPCLINISFFFAYGFISLKDFLKKTI